jgi:hypothetical protein
MYAELAKIKDNDPVMVAMLKYRNATRGVAETAQSVNWNVRRESTTSHRVYWIGIRYWHEVPVSRCYGFQPIDFWHNYPRIIDAYTRRRLSYITGASTEIRFANVEAYFAWLTKLDHDASMTIAEPRLNEFEAYADKTEQIKRDVRQKLENIKLDAAGRLNTELKRIYQHAIPEPGLKERLLGKQETGDEIVARLEKLSPEEWEKRCAEREARGIYP